MKNIVSLSGGKDSTAMLHWLLEKGEPVDEVVFMDTGWEFPAMIEHIKLVERKTGIKVTTLYPEKPLSYWMYHRVKTRGRIGEVGYGWPNILNRWCTTIKTNTLDKHMKTYGGKTPIMQHIGIAADEKRKIDHQKRYPLIEWGKSETACMEYCKEIGYHWGGLYEIFSRVSCWCCPLKGKNDFRKLRRWYPVLWQELIAMGEKQPNHKKSFYGNLTVSEIDQQFAYEDSLPRLPGF